MIETLSHLIGEHRSLLYWFGWVSALMFVVSLAVVPLLLTRIPADYFTRRNKRRDQSGTGTAGRVLFWVGRNIVALLLILAGIAMLILPGQGLLTVLVGLFVGDFPGKYELERKIVSNMTVFKGINWVRGKRGADPLLHPQPPTA